MLSSEGPTEGHGHHGGGDSVHLGHHQGVVSAVTHHRLGEHHVLKVKSGKRKLFKIKYLKVAESCKPVLADIAVTLLDGVHTHPCGGGCRVGRRLDVGIVLVNFTSTCGRFD